MAAGKRYSAGRIFLQVVPSFHNLQNDIQREVGKANRGAEKQQEEIGKKNAEAQERGAAKVRTKSRDQQLREEEKAQARRIAQFQRFTQMYLGEVVKEDKRVTQERDRAENERRRISKKLLDLDIRDTAAALKEKARLEEAHRREQERADERSEARRAQIRRRRAAERLKDLRAADAERRRLAGGAAGGNIRRATQGAADSIGVIDIDANTSKAKRRMAALREELQSISANIGVDLDATTAMGRIKLIQKELFKLSHNDAEIDVNVNATAALLALKRVEQQIDQINRKKATSGFLGMFGGLTGGADQGANSFRIFNYRVLALVTLLPALPPLLATSGAALGAIGTAAIGGAAGLGVMILGFTGLQDAISAMSEVQDAQAKDSLASSKSIRTAGKAVRDAEQGVAQAKEQAARAAEDSARRIADAEQNLADSQRDATKAQKDLALARRQAQADQAALADRIKGGQLDERQALIDLFNAQVDYNAAMADGGATNLEREQASIQLERARLAIKGIRDENAKMKQEAKRPISQDPNVVAAQDNVQRANKQVADARQQVADARKDALQSQADSARAVRDAGERLSDAQIAQQEAITKTADIGSAAVNKLNIAMGKLGPEGQAFARFIFGLQDDFLSLRNLAAAGFLPELQTAITDLIKVYGPSFRDFIRVMADAVGRFFTAFGKALQSPIMKTFFETMAKYAPIFFQQWGDLFINVMKIVAGVATAFAPFAKDFMDWLVDLTGAWADWAGELAGSKGFNDFLDYVKKEGPKVLQLIQDIFIIALNIGKGMADTPIFDALVGLFTFLASLDPKVIASIFTAIISFAMASQIAAGINALAISIGFLLTSAIGPWVAGLLIVGGALVYLYNTNETFRIFVDKVWTAVQQYFAAFLDWIQTSFIPWWTGTAMPIITSVFTAIGKFALWLWDTVLYPTFYVIGQFAVKMFTIIKLAWENILWPAIKVLATVIGWLWTNVFSPIFGKIGEVVKIAFTGMVWVWDNILAPMFDTIIHLLEGDFVGAWQSALDAIGGIWRGLQKLAAVPVNFVIDTVLNNGLFKAFNAVMEFLGLGLRIPKLDLINVPADPYRGPKSVSGKNKTMWDTGGYTGAGAKYDVAGVVHRDEFVLRKEAVGALRGSIGLQGLDYMNRTGRLPGYAIGGMVKPVNASPRFPWGHYPSGKVHRALDLPVPIGTPVVSPFSGYVIKDGWDSSGFGTHVRIAADNGTFWILGHLLREIVSVGQRVLGGTPVGQSGNSGRSTGPHLHVEGRTSPYDPGSAFNFTAAFNGGVTRTPPAGRAGQDLPWWADAPLSMLEGIVKTGVGLIPAPGIFGQMLRGVPDKMFDMVRVYLGDFLGDGELDDVSGAGGKYVWNGHEVGDNGTQMFDNGGLLQPGVTQVLNMTGRPEPVFTAEQFARGAGGGAGGALVGTYAPTFNQSDMTPDDVMDEFVHTLTRVEHGGKYAGRTF